ncbi:MAG: porin family protein [Paludibacter sp.]|nr:porin family protein [Paludibacter sp.]
MKNILKSFTLIISLLLSLNVNAQGIQIGYIQSTTENGNPLHASILNGVRAGFIYENGILDHLSLQYGLNYSYLSGSTSALTEYRTTSHELDIPLRISYGLPISNNFKTFIYAGPNFSYAISNKSKTTLLGQEVESNLYEENSDYTPFNIQMGIGGGVILNNTFIKVGYDWGLSDLNKTTDVVTKTNRFTVSVGYTL